jgi:hypothetical protein
MLFFDVDQSQILPVSKELYADEKNVLMLLPEVRGDNHCASSDVFCTKTYWSFTMAASRGLAAMLWGFSD